MPKKAFLTTFSVTTRVIVDVKDNETLDDQTLIDRVSDTSLKKIRRNIAEDKEYPYVENIDLIKEDTEVPYNLGDSNE